MVRESFIMRVRRWVRRRMGLGEAEIYRCYMDGLLVTGSYLRTYGCAKCGHRKVTLSQWESIPELVLLRMGWYGEVK